MTHLFRWKRLAAGFASAAIVFGTVAFAPTAYAEESLTVRMDFSPWGIQAGMQLAKDRGWFKEAGLSVEVQDGRGSGNTLQLVNAGQVDVGQIQLGLLVGARKQGATVKSFAGFVRKTDLCVLVDKNSPISKISELKGKTLAVFAASPWAPFIDGFLAAGGLTRQTTKILYVDASALWSTYTAGRSDGLMSTIDSAIPVAAKSRPSKCLMLDLAHLYFPSYGLIATEKTIAEHGDALRKLVAVEQRAWKEIKKDPDAGVKAIMDQRPDAKLDPDILREQIKIILDYFNTPATEGKPIGWQAKADWDKTLKGMQRLGLIKAGWKADDYFTNKLVP